MNQAQVREIVGIITGAYGPVGEVCWMLGDKDARGVFYALWCFGEPHSGNQIATLIRDTHGNSIGMFAMKTVLDRFIQNGWVEKTGKAPVLYSLRRNAR